MPNNPTLHSTVWPYIYLGNVSLLHQPAFMYLDVKVTKLLTQDQPVCNYKLQFSTQKCLKNAIPV